MDGGGKFLTTFGSAWRSSILMGRAEGGGGAPGRDGGRRHGEQNKKERKSRAGRVFAHKQFPVSFFLASVACPRTHARTHPLAPMADDDIMDGAWARRVLKAPSASHQKEQPSRAFFLFVARRWPSRAGRERRAMPYLRGPRLARPHTPPDTADHTSMRLAWRAGCTAAPTSRAVASLCTQSTRSILSSLSPRRDRRPGLRPGHHVHVR
jgi:hypothetical protein